MVQVVINMLQDSKDLYNYLKTVENRLDEDLSKYNTKQDLKQHMEELHNYNVIKDATQSLLGSLSCQTGQSVTELHKEFGVKGIFPVSRKYVLNSSKLIDRFDFYLREQSSHPQRKS